MAGVILCRFGPMFNNGIKFFRGRDEAKFIRVRIRQLAIDLDLILVETVRGVIICLPDRIPHFLHFPRRGVER